MTWNDDLASFAQSYIELLDKDSYYNPCLGHLVHSDTYYNMKGLKGRPNYGENIAWGTITDVGAVDMWYNEIKNYDFTDPAKSSTTSEWGHFTQLVWNSSTELGCAYKSDCTLGDSSVLYVICEYNPRGNVLLGNGPEYYFFERNVFPPHYP